MLSSIRLAVSALALPLFVTCSLLAPGTALAQQAASPNDGCSGHLCDLYYGVVGSNPAAQSPPAQRGAQASPPTQSGVPEGSLLGRLFGGSAQQAAAPAMPQPQVQGNGVVALLKGSKPERCGGTICDIYYGSLSPEELRAQQGDGGLAAQPSQALVAQDAVQQTTRTTRAAEVVERRERQRCAASGRDPWSCYR